MTPFHYTNNAQAKLAANVGQGDTQLSLETGEGAKFPSSFPYRLTIWDADNYYTPGDDPAQEIIEVTGSNGDFLDITRAKEDTPDTTHSAGDSVALLITAGTFEDTTHGINPRLNSHFSTIDAHHSNINDPTSDQKAALNGANTPSASNVFATMDDMTSSDDILLLILSMM